MVQFACFYQPGRGLGMKVQRNKMVALGYGRYFRSDKIVGLEPIVKGRGPQRRTHVYVEGRAEPLVASRTEAAILRDLVRPTGRSPEADRCYLLLENILTDLQKVGPMLRVSITHESGLDLNDLEQRIRSLLLEPQQSEGESASSETPQMALEL